MVLDDKQERVLRAYTDPRFVPETARWARDLRRDGAQLAADLAAGKLPPVPAVVVSAGEHGPASAMRRAHERIAGQLPGADLQVWTKAQHPLHLQQPDRVARVVLALLGTGS